MRIVHLPNLYAPSRGGVQRLSEGLSVGLAARGDRVDVFTSDAVDVAGFYDAAGPRIGPGRERRGGVAVRRFPVRHGLRRALFETLPAGLGAASPRARGAFEAADWFSDLRARPFCPGIPAALARARPDVAVAFNAASPFAQACRLARALAGIPYVVFPMLHTGEAWAREPRVDRALAQADAVIVSTRFERDHLVARGLDPGRVEVVPPGIEAASGPPLGRSEAKARLGLGPEPVVGLVGRKDAGKGTRTLIAAMRRVFARQPDCRLLLAGRCEPSFASQLDASLARLSSAERARVVVVGDFPDSMARDAFAACDVFAMASTAESFGIAYLEAWREGVPVIAATGGAPASFLRDGVDAVLVPPRDAEALAAAVLGLLDDPPRARRLADAGRARLGDELGVDRTIERVRGVYAEVLAARPGRAAARAVAEGRP